METFLEKLLEHSLSVAILAFVLWNNIKEKKGLIGALEKQSDSNIRIADAVKELRHGIDLKDVEFKAAMRDAVADMEKNCRRRNGQSNT